MSVIIFRGQIKGLCVCVCVRRSNCGNNFHLKDINTLIAVRCDGAAFIVSFLIKAGRQAGECPSEAPREEASGLHSKRGGERDQIELKV